MTAFQQKWYNRVRAQFGLTSTSAERLMLLTWLRKEMRDDGVRDAQIASEANRIVIYAMTPNRQDVSDANIWREAFAQHAVHEFDRARTYTWRDWLLGLKRPSLAT
jgi:hypothetical protein